MALRGLLGNYRRLWGAPKGPDPGSEKTAVETNDAATHANPEKDEEIPRLPIQDPNAKVEDVKSSFCIEYDDMPPPVQRAVAPPLLQTAVVVVKDAIVVCASELRSRMKKSSLPITFVRMNLDLKDSPPHILNFSLQSFLCHILFKCFEDPSFAELDGLPSFANSAISGKAEFWHAYERCRDMEVTQLLKEEAAFLHFLRSKDAELRKQLKEKFFLTEDVQKAEDFFTLELSSGAKDITYYRKWVRLAKAVWVLHNLAFAFEPSSAEVFRVDKGSVLDAEIMEDVAREDEDDDKEDVALAPVGKEKIKEVRFMCVPGFVVRNTILIKSQVFCVKR